MNTEIEKAKRRINALLLKTVENGASEHEAISALKQAESLMRKYSILKEELGGYKNEKCVLISHKKFKTGYKTEYFLSYLAEVFDCEYYWNHLNVTFFGYKEDVELCIYFYDLILKLCFEERRKFLESKEGLHLKKYSNGRTISANFIKGFLNRINYKLYLMYQDKKKEVQNEEKGLILIKKSRVENEFAEKNFKIKTVDLKQIISDRQSYACGEKSADDVDLLIPLDNKTTENIILIN